MKIDIVFEELDNQALVSFIKANDKRSFMINAN